MNRKWGLILGLALLCSNASAQDSSDSGFHFSPYIGLDAQFNFVNISDESFLPIGSRLRLGAYFWESIGVEATGAFGLKSSEDVGVEVSLDSAYTVNIRWESPDAEGLSAYLLTGYAWNELNVKNNNSYPGSTTLKGPNVGFGVKELYGDWGLFIEFSRQFSKDDVRIDSLNLGTQYQF
ncbi:Uncharacterised protein [BD1-7 clade bacterium]|uniref:Outer membrane protein beta-barrel domain-containing protein n=1 Tax=BD1-7 clade bacterium TaxID=2029982 RepID=A0A5S9N1P5_9GAMM|nr:Uncharacterised protein [BD1-7 clade bacterium]CAA0083601.1 Uncharacterised protein [BD1-7 clade bacterium]